MRAHNCQIRSKAGSDWEIRISAYEKDHHHSVSLERGINPLPIAEQVHLSPPGKTPRARMKTLALSLTMKSSAIITWIAFLSVYSFIDPSDILENLILFCLHAEENWFTSLSPIYDIHTTKKILDNSGFLGLPVTSSSSTDHWVRLWW